MYSPLISILKKPAILMGALGPLLLASPTALAMDATAACEGTLVMTVGADGPDVMMGMQAKLTLNMKADATATMTLENEFVPKMTGTGKETGDENNPWQLEAKDAGGVVFSGGFKPLQPTSPSDTSMHIILTLKSTNALLSGPMSCTLK